MEEHPLLEPVVRNLGAAWRASRLYPQSSPIPLAAAQSVAAAVEEYLQAEPSLRLTVTPGGFLLRGIDAVFTGPGAPEIADALGVHGIAELHFVAPPASEEILAFLESAAKSPRELRELGGMQAVLNAAGPGTIKAVPVALSAAETLIEIPEEDADKFLAELAADSQRLAVWLRAMLTYDDESLTEGLRELARVSDDLAAFGGSMADSFIELDVNGKDRLLEVAIGLEEVRDILVEMLGHLTVSDVTAAIRGGRYGGNPMSISWALARLPMGDRSEELVAEMEAALRASDTTTEEQVAFLKRMLAVRRTDSCEQPLVEARPAYGSLLQASAVAPEHVTAAANETAARTRLDGRGVDTVLGLLTAADDLEKYSSVLDALARSVPHLIEAGDPELALRLTRDVAGRGVASSKGWPELDARLQRAVQEACGTRSMSALLSRYASDEKTADHAAEFVRIGGDAAGRSLAEAAIASTEGSALQCAEAVLGRRLPELLAVDVGAADEHNAATIAEVLSRDSGPRCMQALEHLVSRPEDRVRREAARGIAAGGGRAVAGFAPRLLRDSSAEVAMVTARALGRTGVAGTAAILGARLFEIEGEHDLPLAREIVAVLANSAEETASEELRRVADRKSLMHKGRFAAAKKLARDALVSRRERGAG